MALRGFCFIGYFETLHFNLKKKLGNSINTRFPTAALQLHTKTQVRNEVKIWVRGHNHKMNTSRVVILTCDTSH